MLLYYDEMDKEIIQTALVADDETRTKSLQYHGGIPKLNKPLLACERHGIEVAEWILKAYTAISH